MLLFLLMWTLPAWAIPGAMIGQYVVQVRNATIRPPLHTPTNCELVRIKGHHPCGHEWEKHWRTRLLYLFYETGDPLM